MKLVDVDRKISHWVISMLLCAMPIMGCVAMDNRVDHSVQIKNVGKTGVTNLTYIYGSLGERSTPNLGLGGDSVTKSMAIPEFIDVTWTAEVDGKTYQTHVPLKAKVSEDEINGKIVSIEINGASLKVYLVKRLPNFKRERVEIYSNASNN